MGDLIPCPFCGSTDLRLNEFEQYGICNSCNAFGPSFDIVDERDAIAAWNTRATPPEVTALVEALTLAANRLQRCAVDFDAGSHEFIETSEWATDARAALAKWEAAQ